ncbi:MAG: hypothetical protein LBO81_05045 [Clostridiales Family XIII bacterium]|jgi:hypothetical protein|nr:hypothetical protein [Clostridiales Family XIII bacterium]
MRMFESIRKIMTGRSARRTVAAVVVLCIVALLLASALLMITHTHHGCNLQPCAVCVKIESLLAILKTVASVFALCAGLFPLSALLRVRCGFLTDPDRCGRRTLFSQGIRLNI